MWSAPSVVELTPDQDALLAAVGLPKNGDPFHVRVGMAIRLGIEKQRQDVRAAWLIEPVTSLLISKRVANILERNGIVTVGDLTRKTAGELVRIPRLASRSLWAIEDALSECGHRLADR